MNVPDELYKNEPQYVWNTFTGEQLSTISVLPCGLSVQNETLSDINLLHTLDKGRIWYNFNSEAFVDTPIHNVYNEKLFNMIKEQDFSLSLLTTSKTVMKYVNILQKIREVEAGVWFSSDEAKNNIFTQRLDILRRLYFSDIFTVAYLNTEGNITDTINLAELISGLCHRAYLYGKKNSVIDIVKNIFEEHKKTVHCIIETNNPLLL